MRRFDLRSLRINVDSPELFNPDAASEAKLDWMITEWMKSYTFGDIAELVPLRLAMPIGEEFLKLLRLCSLELDEKTVTLMKAHSDRAFREEVEEVMRSEINQKKALPPRFWAALAAQEIRLLREWRTLEDEIK
jgi:hypothetical protein